MDSIIVVLSLISVISFQDRLPVSTDIHREVATAQSNSHVVMTRDSNYRANKEVAIVESSAERAARTLVEQSRDKGADSIKVEIEKREFTVELPPHISAKCVNGSARDYEINPFILLSVLKQESGGKTGIVSQNTNGTYDLGPAQFNTSSWAAIFQNKFSISRDALINNMCQAIRAMAYAVRTEIDKAGGDIWKGIGNYHSRTPAYHQRYVKAVYAQYQRIIAKGKF